MKEEMKSLISNQTWELSKLLIGKKALHNKWVYRVKDEHDGSKRYKAQLVVKGVSNSALGLLYGHDILTIYENLLL